MLIKVKSSHETRTEILEIADIFRSKVVDISVNSITLEVVGDPGKSNNYSRTSKGLPNN